MKKFVIFILLACYAAGVQAQSMSDSQVMEFILKEHKRGTSQATIVTKLMQRGVNITQIRRVRDNYQKLSAKTTEQATASTKVDDRTRKNNAQQQAPRSDADVADETRRIYDEEEQRVNRYSSMRNRRGGYVGSTYDSYDGEFVAMTDELDSWMPADTAAAYRQLVNRMKNERRHKQVFGRDIFNRQDLSFEPNMNIATPQNYRLGPGDAVYIDIYGASQKTIQATVSPDGFVTIEGFGPIQVSGLSVAQANQRIKNQMGPRYSSSQIRLSVGQTRSIMVNVMGEVRKPGTYTLSAFASVFHALHMAGGISDLGTLRSIKVYRNNQLITSVDVYDYMLNGRLTGNVKLADNDVIVVGAYDCLVSIEGKVKRPMYYEMKKGESLETLLRYAGGFTGDAYTKSVRLIRKTGKQYSIYNVNEFDMPSFQVADDDSVSVDSIIPRFENMVEIKGAVFRPGKYQVGDDINSVRTLIEAAEGLTEYAFAPHAVMHRMRPDRTLEVIAVDVKGILAGTTVDIPLQNEDVLFIPTRQDAQVEQTITIHGEVQYPGVYKYAANETLEDFVLQAGGLKETASTVKVDVSRRIIDNKASSPDSLIARTYTFELKDGFVIDGEPAFHLQPFDEVYVRRSPGYSRQQNVVIDGEVLFAGTYTLTKRNTRLSDLVKLAGGTNDLAYIKGARLERRINETERLRMQAVLKMQQENQRKNIMTNILRSSNAAAVTQVAEQQKAEALEKFNFGDTYYVGIELDKA
ncbi:MAG: SLBB domain-containing protein, partial [Prevotella sp.]|nr:SLBB domain-containing protein [Prevotella sp.]